MRDLRVKYIDQIAKLINNEGMVLLKNDNHLLPIQGKVNLFGRIQFNYYKSGTGSGGLVNTDYVYSLYDIMSNSDIISLNPQLSKKYLDYVEKHPFNYGNGLWASEPWNQEEMPLTKEDVLKATAFSDVAIYIIGRTAGEDKDFSNVRGSYKLTEVELNNIKLIRKYFKKIILILNVGTIIDLSEIVDCFDAILLGYHGGFYGAISLYENITGLSRPSGSLPFTVLKDINKDITTKNFGKKETIYEEDIYVGYRYHNTFLDKNILFPFGYGLSYSDIYIKNLNASINHTKIKVSLDFINKSNIKDNKTIFFFIKPPQGKLGKPKYELISFYKPERLIGSTEIKHEFDLYDIASFDDFGLIKKNSFVIEKGTYILYAGFYIGDERLKYQFEIKEDILYPKQKPIPITKGFKRLINDNGVKRYEYINLISEKPSNQKTDIKYIPNNYTFNDFLKGSIQVEKLIEGLSDLELTYLVKGEGMSSPKVTPGIAAATGGLTKKLKEKEIPILAYSDGPSGIRMDSGFLASSLPNGAVIASSYSLTLIEKLFKLVGLEMKRYKIDCLLGPGVNILRNHLNGRNFEYFSEDPIVTGMIAASVIKGLHAEGRVGSLKHFICNNQEFNRFTNEVWVSNRAFREIYLKGFEYAIRHSNVKVIMSSYNYLNGYHTSTHPILYKDILRKEIGFDGIMITDWWAHTNSIDEPLDKKTISKMVKAHHDLYMVVEDTKNHDDDLIKSLRNGSLTRGDLAAVIKNQFDFYKYLLKLQQKQNRLNKDFETLYINHPFIEKDNQKYYSLVIEENKKPQTIINDDKIVHLIRPISKTNEINIPKDIKLVKAFSHLGEKSLIDKEVENGSQYLHYQIEITEEGCYRIEFDLKNESSSLSQTSITMFFDKVFETTYTFSQFDGILKTGLNKNFKKGMHIFTIKLNQQGLKFVEISITRIN